MATGLTISPSYWASVSGGKDSLYMLNLILHNLDRYPLDGVVHFELEIDYPFIHDVVNYMEQECKRAGIPFLRIKPRKTWKELYDKYGFPTRKARWCNSKYKLDCKKQLNDFLKSKGCYAITYIGYCADEQNRANAKSRNKLKQVYPLIENGILEDTILEWAKTQSIFKDFYKYNKRCGCMLCPMQSLSEQAYLAKYYPLHYAEMNSLASETEIKREKELRRSFSVWASNPKYNTQYRDRRIYEKYLPELDAKIDKKNI